MHSRLITIICIVVGRAHVFSGYLPHVFCVRIEYIFWFSSFSVFFLVFFLCVFCCLMQLFTFLRLWMPQPLCTVDVCVFAAAVAAVAVAFIILLILCVTPDSVVYLIESNVLGFIAFPLLYLFAFVICWLFSHPFSLFGHLFAIMISLKCSSLFFFTVHSSVFIVYYIAMLLLHKSVTNQRLKSYISSNEFALSFPALCSLLSIPLLSYRSHHAELNIWSTFKICIETCATWTRITNVLFTRTISRANCVHSMLLFYAKCSRWTSLSATFQIPTIQYAEQREIRTTFPPN